MVNHLKNALEAFKGMVSRWWRKSPVERASIAFVAGEGFIESIFIISNGVAMALTGHPVIFGLMLGWAMWEIFARTVVVRHVLGVPAN